MKIPTLTDLLWQLIHRAIFDLNDECRLVDDEANNVMYLSSVYLDVPPNPPIPRVLGSLRLSETLCRFSQPIASVVHVSAASLLQARPNKIGQQQTESDQHEA